MAEVSTSRVARETTNAIFDRSVIVGGRLGMAFLDSLIDPVYLAVRFHRKCRFWPNIFDPKTFNEKILFKKLQRKNKRLSTLVDKIAVKEVVANLLGEDWVTPTLWRGQVLPPREERIWPKPYVLKANHGSGFNYFVKDDAAEDWDLIEEASGKWLKENFGRRDREWPYQKVRRELFVEPFIAEIDDVVDYKFFIFNGVAQYIEVDTNRYTDHKRTMFNINWERQPFCYQYKSDPDVQDPPGSLEQMVRGAEALAADLDFARVDLYEVDGKPRFGEMTFFPIAGYGRFDPPEYDLTFGKLWKLAG